MLHSSSSPMHRTGRSGRAAPAWGRCSGWGNGKVSQWGGAVRQRVIGGFAGMEPCSASKCPEHARRSVAGTSKCHCQWPAAAAKTGANLYCRRSMNSTKSLRAPATIRRMRADLTRHVAHHANPSMCSTHRACHLGVFNAAQHGSCAGVQVCWQRPTGNAGPAAAQKTGSRPPADCDRLSTRSAASSGRPASTLASATARRPWWVSSGQPSTISSCQ